MWLVIKKADELLSALRLGKPGRLRSQCRTKKGKQAPENRSGKPE